MPQPAVPRPIWEPARRWHHRSLGNCTELQALLLSSNNLDDIIPPEIGHLKNLRALDVSRNSLSGPVPAELGGCIQLSVLVLSNPYASPGGSDSSDYGEPDDFNYFQGGIPDAIARQPKLRMLCGRQGSHWRESCRVIGVLARAWR